MAISLLDPSFPLENFHRRHERIDPQRYGSSPMLMDRGGSHPDLYGDCGRFRHDNPYGYSFHGPPPCCFFSDMHNHYWNPPSYGRPKVSKDKTETFVLLKIKILVVKVFFACFLKWTRLLSHVSTNKCTEFVVSLL